MNIDNINKTIDLIKADQSLAFYMGQYIIPNISDRFKNSNNIPNECGTACCLAGYACIAEYGSYQDVPVNAEGEDWDGERDTWVDHFKHGMELFGIDEDTAEELFTPGNGHIDSTSKEDAIKVLETFRDTGKVIWDDLPIRGNSDEDED